MSIRGVHHVALSVPDIEKARDFYVSVLGFQECSRLEWADAPAVDEIVGLNGSAAKLMMLKLGNFHLELFEYSAPAPAPLDPQRGVNQYGYTHFAFEVTDIKAEYQRLLAAGVTFNSKPAYSANSGATYGRDPFGNVIELIEIPAESNFPRLP